MYNLESLGDERFQKLCQALLLKSHPDLQSLPVGQPDGGRDAFHKHGVGKLGSSTIFQVKFVLDPRAKESREIIEKIAKGESEKVRRLKERGASRYYLMTNAVGSSHLDVGAVDRVNEVLSELLDIPAYCLWRDDIERRLDADASVRWSYPEILSAKDMLDNLLNQRLDSDAKRRADTIRAYMAYQAKQDSHLKFKQVELQKTIADLFVDVPAKVMPLKGEGEIAHITEWRQFCDENNLAPLGSDIGMWLGDGEPAVGALELLISPAFAVRAPKIVVEGAPGQGKSTITQYLCQVFRLMLLDRPLDFSRIDERHRPTVARLPLRVDLRDYASWLSGKDPAGGEIPENMRSSTPVLEQFLAAQIHRATGAAFSVDDLTAVASGSQVVIVLDGFDEVAEVKIRNRIVEEVSMASERIAENALSSQIIVTSRPAVFANSPGFPRDEWRYVEILPLTQPIMQLYAEKWLSARDVDDVEKLSVLTVLKDKLEQVHVRDLARNPMQLAILLSLIAVHGSSLPDKRTELYDAYIDIFLNRESEKSQVVRDHRGLIVLIHRYLAWHIHAVAEDQNGSGHLREGELKRLIREYLEVNAFSTELVGQLFTGMVERVVVLVSRIQGTFEFEVQPLREYFAARHLYDTAPQVPAARKVKGSKPERFDALARNFYWLNVTRFYAGCYSSGELSSLLDGIDELYDDPAYESLGYIAELSLTLLKDHVFALHPRLALRLLDRMIRGASFPVLLAETRQQHGSDRWSMPTSTGKDRFVEFAKEVMSENPRYDRMYSAARLLRANANAEAIIQFWWSVQGKLPDHVWIDLAVCLDVWGGVKAEELKRLWPNYGELIVGGMDLLRYGELGDSVPGLWDLHFQHMTRYGSYGFPYLASMSENKSPVALLANYVSFLFWPYLFDGDNQFSKTVTVRDAIVSMFSSRELIDQQESLTLEFGLCGTKLEDLAGAMDRFLCMKWQSALDDCEGISSVIEECRRIWGDGKGISSLAINYAASCTAEPPALTDFFDPSSPLCARMLYAARNRSSGWWREQLERAAVVGGHDAEQVILAAARFLDLSEILQLSKLFDEVLEKVGAEWSAVAFGMEEGIQRRKQVMMNDEDLPSVPEKMSVRLAAVIANSVADMLQRKIVSEFLSDYSGDDRYVLSAYYSRVICNAFAGHGDWDDILPKVRSFYADGVYLRIPDFESNTVAVPIETARQVCRSPEVYPMDLVAIAARTLKVSTGAAATSLAKVAEREGWFAEE